jgi:riboflavin kinase/FMN adenylyltransferase
MLEAQGGAVSSSRVRALLREGAVEAANALLGRRFAIDFEVVHGRRIGRTLGTPTINQPLPDGFIEPRFGVYATATRLGGEVYSSVTNVGVKPTFGSDRALAETYIHGFSGDLYGQKPLVEFIGFIRPERRFESPEALRAQIMEDNERAAEVFQRKFL